MATRGNAKWKNKRRKSLYNKEDSSNNFIYRLSSSPSPAPVSSPTLDPSVPVLSFPPPDPSKPLVPSPPPLAPPTPFREAPSVPTNDLSNPPESLVPSPPPLAPPTPFRAVPSVSTNDTNDLSKLLVPSPPPLAPPTPFRVAHDPPRRKKRKKRKVDDEESSQIENDIAICLGVNKICRMEIDKLDKIHNEILTETNEDCILQANKEMKQSSRFDKETQERINDSIRKRIDTIKMHVKRKKEMLLCTQETLTPRSIIHKLSAHASKVIKTPSLTHK